MRVKGKKERKVITHRDLNMLCPTRNKDKTQPLTTAGFYRGWHTLLGLERRAPIDLHVCNMPCHSNMPCQMGPRFPKELVSPINPHYGPKSIAGNHQELEH
jgi:hypothetical protein